MNPEWTIMFKHEVNNNISNNNLWLTAPKGATPVN